MCKAGRRVCTVWAGRPKKNAKISQKLKRCFKMTRGIQAHWHFATWHSIMLFATVHVQLMNSTCSMCRHWDCMTTSEHRKTSDLCIMVNWQVIGSPFITLLEFKSHSQYTQTWTIYMNNNIQYCPFRKDLLCEKSDYANVCASSTHVLYSSCVLE